MRRWWLIAAIVAALLAGGAAHAALPAVHSLGVVRPTPSGVVNSKYRDGDDGTTAIPLLWGVCPSLATTTTASDSFNLRTLCNLIEAGSPTSTLSLFAGSLPTGCVMATDGIDCTTPTAGSASVTVRATRGAATADVVVNITVTTAGTDSTEPTVPLGLVATDNADGTGVLSWDASSDPSVGGIATGVASYRVKKDGGTHSTVTAPSANVQPVLAETVIGASDSEASSQSGADWTLTFGGGGLVAAGDHILARLAAVTGDFTATAKITSYAPSAGTTGSVGIAARASTSANVIAAYARWKDSDDQCNLRYRWQAGSMANGTDSAATYTLPVWIRLERSGDVFTAACSSDGNAWVTTSSHSVSPGATVYVGPFITSGTASTTTATGTVAEFSVHQGSAVSAPITASGSYTVSAYDGTNRSAESAAVAATVTGGTPASLVTVPAATHSVCVGGVASGCDYDPSQLATVAISARVPGDVLELRTAEAGGSEPWSARILCNGVSGTSSDPIWVAVRAGDTIMLDSSTAGGVGLIDLTDCDYLLTVGSRDGGTTGLKLADRDRWHQPPAIHQNPDVYDLYPNSRAVMVRSSTGVALVGMTIAGAASYGASQIDSESSRVLLKYVDIGRHGTNAYDLDNDGAVTITPGSLSDEGDTDSGEIMTFLPSLSVIDTLTMHHSGHTQIQPVGPYQVIRHSDFNGDWSDVTDYPQYTGNHMGNFLPQRSSWGSSTFFGPLIEDNVFRGVGSEPEHKLTNESLQILALNPILRGNFFAQRAGADGYWGRFGPALWNSCAAGTVSGFVVEFTDLGAYLQAYNNTSWGGAVLDSSGTFPGVWSASIAYSTGAQVVSPSNWRKYQRTATDTGQKTLTDPSADATHWTQTAATTYTAPSCGHWNVRNNLFQGVQPHMRRGSNSLTSFSHTVEWTTNGPNTGHANAWKSSVWTGNVFGTHPSDPASATYHKVFLGSKSGGTGTGTVALTDSTTWPNNWYSNTDTRVTWASGTTTAMANAVSDAVPSAAAIRAALVPAAASDAVVRNTAVAMTTVAAGDSGSGTTLVLNNARWIYDGWDIDEYDWGGIHQEYADCIAVGPAADSTLAEAVVVGVSEETDIVYSTGTVTIDSIEGGVTRVAGSPVWPATRNSDGTCGAVWADKGAAQ